MLECNINVSEVIEKSAQQAQQDRLDNQMINRITELDQETDEE